jgi:RHS repeat-associated protein
LTNDAIAYNVLMAPPTRRSLHPRSHSRSRVHARSDDARSRLSKVTNVTLGSDDLSPTTRYAHNLLGQRVFKTNPVLPPAPGDESDPVFMQSLLNYFAQVWNPTVSNPQAAQDSIGTAYLYGHEGHLGDSTVLLEYNNVAGTPSAQHIYLPTPQGPLPVLAVLGGTRYAVIADHLHTPRRLMQTRLITNWQWPYSAFGEEPPTQRKYRFVNPATVNLGETTTAAALNYNLRFAGQVADVESGLFYNYFRSYDPKQGRYSQSDPIGLAGGWNRFGYVGGNPLKYTDPYGLQKTLRDLLGPDYKDQPPPPDYPTTTDKRPYLPPPPPPPPPPEPPSGAEPWPGANDWRGQCIRLYTQCKTFNWTGSCDSCLNKCTAQQEWPFSGPGACRPRRRNQNFCSAE